MESNWLTRKLAKWAFILHECDFDIIHKHGRVNQDADVLNQNPSPNTKDAIGAHWHDEWI
jgi:hypothetical protein